VPLDADTFVDTDIVLLRLLLLCHAECRWHGAASFSHTGEVAPRFAEVL